MQTQEYLHPQRDYWLPGNFQVFFDREVSVVAPSGHEQNLKNS
jgi:hypothetical protein